MRVLSFKIYSQRCKNGQNRSRETGNMARGEFAVNMSDRRHSKNLGVGLGKYQFLD